MSVRSRFRLSLAALNDECAFGPGDSSLWARSTSRAAGAGRVRGPNCFSRRAAEAGQAAAIRPPGARRSAAVAVRPAGQPAGLPPGISSLHFGRHSQAERAATAGSADAGRIDACSCYVKGGRTHFVPRLDRVCRRSSAAISSAALPGVSSADIFHACQANCYVELPPKVSSRLAGIRIIELIPRPLRCGQHNTMELYLTAAAELRRNCPQAASIRAPLR